MNKLTKLVCAVAFASVGTAANANLINIDAGSASGGIYMGAQTATDMADFGFQIDSATSQYFDTNGTGGNVDVGDFFVDTGSTNPLTLNGTLLSTSECTVLGIPGTETDCYGTTWNLTADYLLYGQVVDTGTGLAGGIGGGYFNINFNDLRSGTPTQVTSLAVVGSNGPIDTSVGVNIDGVVDYSFLGGAAPSSFVEDFFNFASPLLVGGVSSTNWYDLWAAGMAADPKEFVDVLAVTTLNGLAGQPLVEIETLSYGTDTDTLGLSGLSPFQSALLETGLDNAGVPDTGAFINGTYLTTSRTGEKLSGNISATVAEPSSIAILGLGLLGFSGMARRRKA